MGGDDVSDESIREVLEYAVFRLENKKRGTGKHWCVVGLGAGRIHTIPFKFGWRVDEIKRELARTLVKTYGTMWRDTFESEGDG